MTATPADERRTRLSSEGERSADTRPTEARTTDDRTAAFERQRGQLRGLAYRMLGSMSDADDIVQETFLRWHQADADAIRTPRAWLMTVATRLSLDRLRSAAVDRTEYVGEWLPEPILDEDLGSPARRAERASDVSLAFLRVLERLGPEERAAFLLHDVFDAGYADIASVLNKTEAACRKLVQRARTRVRDDRPRFRVPPAVHERLAARFLTAVEAGDSRALMALLAEDAVLVSDGGGNIGAAVNPIVGRDRILRLFEHTQFVFKPMREYPERVRRHQAAINGTPGILLRFDESVISTLTFEIANGRITALYVVANPDKLRRVQKPDA